MKRRHKCIECSCEDFMHVRSEVLPDAPVVLLQCEWCGKQYSTGVLSWLGLPTLPTLPAKREVP